MTGSAKRARPAAIMRGPFSLLWAGQTVSLLGDGVFMVAFTWQVAVQWRQPALLGGLFGTRVLAQLVALGLGGWIIDRVPRRTTMLAADAARGLLLFGLAATLHRPAPAATLAVLIAAFGFATGLFQPALLAYVPEVVPRERLATANSMFALSMQASLVLGPAIGATLVGLGSATTALRLDGLSFAVAALATLPLPARPRAATAGGALTQAAEGFRVVRRVGWVGGTILLLSVTNIATISAERLALPRAAQERYGQLGGYGAMLVAIGAGAVVAAVATGRSRAPREPGRIAYGGILLFGLATAGFGVGHGIAAAVVIGLAFGFGQQLCELLWITGLQQNSPDQLLGRINAVDHFGSFLFLPVSFAFGGLVVQAISAERVLVAAGAAAVLAAVIGLALPGLHRWRPFGADVGARPAAHTLRAQKSAAPVPDGE